MYYYCFESIKARGKNSIGSLYKPADRVYNSRIFFLV